MSDLGLMGPHRDEDPDQPDDQHPDGLDGAPGEEYYQRVSRADRRRGGRRGGGGSHRGWLPGLILAVVAAVVIAVAAVGVVKVRERLSPPADYAGPGTGSVLFQVRSGDTPSDMAPELAQDGVVKTSAAFLASARKDGRSSTIQVGYYRLKKQMAAKDALAVLLDPDNQVQSQVTVTEGARVRSIVKTIVARTDITTAALTSALRDPAALGLPAAAHGNPEGYLYPATYVVTPGESARTLLKAMVAKSVAVDSQLQLAARAERVNLSAEQVLTVASILEYEANRSVDYPKVARVIYNRLNAGMPLQLDSTVSYVSGREGDVWTTAAERDSDSDYNTYKSTGLPPGPIGSPGQETIDAALHPAKGPWLYFVPDFAHHTTLFTASLAQHERNVAKAKEYCRTHDSC